jgi:hypothetical protein
MLIQEVLRDRERGKGEYYYYESERVSEGEQSGERGVNLNLL